MNLWNTLRVATRTWVRTPALAVATVVTLALGIGATTSAFTAAYSILVQRFPFPEPDRLVWVTTYDTRTSGERVDAIGSNRLPQFANWQQQLTSFEHIGAWSGERPDVFTVTGAGTPERVSGLRVTAQLLPMLGATPLAGRLFQSGEDIPGAGQTVVLSHGYWQRRFAGRTDVLGQSLTIENTLHTIVGVVSPQFPLSGSLFAGEPIDLYLPLAVDGNNDIGGFMAVVGRLRPGVYIPMAQAPGFFQSYDLVVRASDPLAGVEYSRGAVGNRFEPGARGVEPRDGLAVTSASVVVLAAALIAAYLPARRAPRLDPMTLLRAE